MTPDSSHHCIIGCHGFAFIDLHCRDMHSLEMDLKSVMWGKERTDTQIHGQRSRGLLLHSLIFTSSPETQWVYHIHLNRAAGLLYTDFGEGQV